MRKIGAHISIAGGIHRAIHKACKLDINAVQIFLKNSNRWEARPYNADDLNSYREALDLIPDIALFAHSGYLINLAGEGNTHDKSMVALRDELHRARQLGIEYLIIHPGSHGGRGLDKGIERIAQSLNSAIDGSVTTKILLETTAGQGTSVGHRFEHLRAIIDRTDRPEMLGVCIDTCHIFAAGYDISSSANYDAVISEFEKIIGLNRLSLIHLNDSRRECGSRVDRHIHIGEGHIGEGGFGLLLNDPRLAGVPIVLETPKSKDDTADMMNLEKIRGLIKPLHGE